MKKYLEMYRFDDGSVVKKDYNFHVREIIDVFKALIYIYKDNDAVPIFLRRTIMQKPLCV